MYYYGVTNSVMTVSQKINITKHKVGIENNS